MIGTSPQPWHGVFVTTGTVADVSARRREALLNVGPMLEVCEDTATQIYNPDDENSALQ